MTLWAQIWRGGETPVCKLQPKPRDSDRGTAESLGVKIKDKVSTLGVQASKPRNPRWFFEAFCKLHELVYIKNRLCSVIDRRQIAGSSRSIPVRANRGWSA